MGVTTQGPERAGIRTILIRIAIITGIILLVWALSDVVLMIFFAVLLAAVLRGAADWLAERTGAGVRPMLAVVAILLLALVVGFGFWVGPQIARESQDLVTQLTHQIQSLQQRFGQSELVKGLSKPGAVATHLAGSATTVASSTLRIIIDALVVLVTALYFAASPGLYVRGALHLLPLPYRPRVHAVMEEIAHVLRFWLLGQLVDMVVVGILSGVGLWLLHVPLPVALGVIAGLLTFVPYFGAIAAAVPAIMIALAAGPAKVLWVVAVFAVCHLVEGYVISPLVQRRMVELPPALTILGMTVMSALFGPLGIVLGTPLAATVLVAVRELYVRDVLGDTSIAEAQRGASV